MKIEQFILGILLFVSLPINAKLDGRDRALSVANSFLGKDVTLCSNGASTKVRNSQSAITEEAYYIFNASDGKGFVIVSNESSMPEIVAYSFASCVDENNMPDGFIDYLNNYSDLVDGVRSGSKELVSAKRIEEAKPVVGPLCTAMWGQSSPYNNLCPVVNSKHCVAGCVAIAMAQVMHYYSWPKVGRGKKSYSSDIAEIGSISTNFAEHEYSWDVMKNTAAENLESEESSAAVAQLCYDCGIASHMRYGTSGSGTHDDNAMEALYRYFGYKASTIRQEYRDCYADDEAWASMLRDELDEKRPILCGGYGSVGGHEFVVDGYDTNGYFHVNWGWSGSSDGFFLISALNPTSGYDFNTGNSVVIGVTPDPTLKDYFGFQTRAYMLEPPTIASVSANLGANFNFTLHTFYNRSLTSKMWTIGAGLFNPEGELLQVLNGKRASGKEQFISGYGYESYDVMCTLPKTLEDGGYTIRAITQENGYEEWVLPHMVGGTQLNAIPISVEEGKVYFNKVAAGIESISNNHPLKCSSEYYDLQGRKLQNSSNGPIIIYKEYYSDGSTKIRKVLSK